MRKIGILFIIYHCKCVHAAHPPHYKWCSHSTLTTKCVHTAHQPQYKCVHTAHQLHWADTEQRHACSKSVPVTHGWGSSAARPYLSHLLRSRRGQHAGHGLPRAHSGPGDAPPHSRALRRHSASDCQLGDCGVITRWTRKINRLKITVPWQDVTVTLASVVALRERITSFFKRWFAVLFAFEFVRLIVTTTATTCFPRRGGARFEVGIQTSAGGGALGGGG